MNKMNNEKVDVWNEWFGIKWFIIDTQIHENYGYRWKPKGGNTFHIYAETAEHAVVKWRELREAQGFKNNDHSTEDVMGVAQGEGNPEAITQQEIDCTDPDDGYCWDRVDRSYLEETKAGATA